MNPDEPKSFLEHLEDLRWVIVRSCIALAIGMTISAIYTKELLQLITHPLRVAGKNPETFLRVLGVLDPFSIHLEISFSGGILLALPFILYFLGTYLLPALSPKEKQFLLPTFLSGALLFLSGVLFCYFILLPKTLQFFFDYNEWFGFQTEWTIQNYMEFILQMLLAFGISFELPLVIMLLNFLGIVSHEMLKSGRRHSIIAILIFAAIITPTSDVFSLMLLSIPMYLLYEVTIWLTLWRERKEAHE